MKAFRTILLLLAALVAVVATGVFGYHFLEGWGWFDSFYMVLTTLTTIGGGEVHPLSRAGRIFNSGIIILGVGVVFCIIGALTQALIEFEFNEVFGRRKMQREISRLKDHYIICGGGRVGRAVARELALKPAPFVIIENNNAKIEKFSADWLVINGDATQESVMKQVRIEHAAGLVAATTTDAINTYIVLTARSLNPKLKIIARISEEDAEKHLRAAGANAVMSPYTFTGWRIAHAFLRPNVVNFLESTMVQHEQYGLDIEEYYVREGSPFAGKSVRNSNIRQDFNVILLTIRHKDNTTIFNPKPDDIIEAGDQIIFMGETESLNELEATTLKDKA